MEKALVLVGMKDYKAAIEFEGVVYKELSERSIHVGISSNVRMCLVTPRTEIRFVYNPPYQNIDGLRADAVFGFPEYAEPLYPHLKSAARKHPDVGLVDWIVWYERSCEERDRYIYHDVATVNLAAAMRKAAVAFANFGRPKFPEIERVHFSGPVTCVIWSDGTKTLVRCGENDVLDPEKGLAMAIAKKVLGTNKTGSDYYDTFKKWLPKPEVEEDESNERI